MIKFVNICENLLRLLSKIDANKLILKAF